MNHSTPQWQVDYAKWIGRMPINEQNGDPFMGTGPTTTPAAMYGSQHMGQPKQMNGNALMQERQPADPGYGLGQGQMPQHLNDDGGFAEFVRRAFGGMLG